MVFKLLRSKNKTNKVDEAKKLHQHYAQQYDKMPIDEEMIVYETRDGKSIVDSPLAMFRYLASHPEYAQYKHVWIVDKSVEQIETSLPDYLKDKAQMVERGSIEYIECLLKAKYLISNSTLEAFFSKRPGQIYINTWHGTPLKHMGFDIPGNPNQSQNVMRNFLMADYILSPNAHTSEVFIDRYKLRGIYPGEVLEGGYPRIDRIFNADESEVKSNIESYGVKHIDKPVILFCPTWKGTNIHNTSDNLDQIISETLRLVETYQHKYSILLKVHPYVYNKVKEDPRVSDYLVSDLIDACEVMRITDMLITDYSSIFFDFLVTGKPIIFYTWDKDLYQVNRGMYFEDSELPGPMAENMDELIACIDQIETLSPTYQERYERLADQIVPYEDGQVTEKYIDYIFRKKEVSNLTIHKVDSDKKKIIIYPGGMANNGITSSALNLINNIDYTKYDVTVMLNSRNSQESIQNIRLLNPNARPMFRFGSPILTAEESEVDQEFNKNGLPVEARDKYPEKAYKREMGRLTANLKFDTAIDFSGYSYFWARHILSVNAKKYTAFMHNDLVADSEREINGKKPHFSNLNALFSIYYKFDRLLSVSPMTRDVNLEKLGDRVRPDQMSYVHNTINIEKILFSHEETDNIKESKLSVSIKNMEIAISSEAPLYKNIDHIESNISSKIKLYEGDRVVEQARYKKNNQDVYVKIVLNDMYVGWISAEYVKTPKFSIDKIEPYYSISTVSKNVNYPIWKNIRQNTKEDQMIAYARHFQNRYFETDQVAHTSNGKYFRVKYNGETMGWMSSKPLQRQHRLMKNSPLLHYFRYKQIKLEKQSPVKYTDSIQKVTEYGIIKNKETFELWTDAKGTTGSSLKKINRKNYENEVFKITEKSSFLGEIYCKAYTSKGRLAGYICEKDLTYVEEQIYLDFINVEEDDNPFSLPKVDLVGQKVSKFDKNMYNFLTMGRLSPEKNHSTLISAFHQFNSEFPDSRLYILGKGPLEKDLIQKVKDLKLQGKVFLLGHIKDPFNFIKEMDAFVLPSFYEGQPMVLLETMVLKMNIVASNIPANINVLGADETYGLLMEGTDQDAVYEGLKRMYHFEGSFKTFDYKTYNEEAIEGFYLEMEPDKK